MEPQHHHLIDWGSRSITGEHLHFNDTSMCTSRYSSHSLKETLDLSETLRSKSFGLNISLTTNTNWNLSPKGENDCNTVTPF